MMSTMANEPTRADVYAKCNEWMARNEGAIIVTHRPCDSVSGGGTTKDTSYLYPRLANFASHAAVSGEMQQHQEAPHYHGLPDQNNNPFHANPSSPGPPAVAPKRPLSHFHSLYHPEEFSAHNPAVFSPRQSPKPPPPQTHLQLLHPSQQDMHFSLPPVVEEESNFDNTSIKTCHTTLSMQHPTSSFPAFQTLRAPHPSPLQQDFRHANNHIAGVLFESHSDTVSLRTDNSMSVINGQLSKPLSQTRHVRHIESNQSDTCSIRTDNTYVVYSQIKSESHREQESSKRECPDDPLIVQERTPSRRREGNLKSRGAEVPKTQRCCKIIRLIAGLVSFVSLATSGFVMYCILFRPFELDQGLVNLHCNLTDLLERHAYWANSDVFIINAGGNNTNCTTILPTAPASSTHPPLLYKHVQIEADSLGQDVSNAEYGGKRYYRLKVSNAESDQSDPYSIVVPKTGIYFVYFGIYLVNNQKCSSLAEKTSEAYLLKMAQGRESQLSRSEHTCCEDCDTDRHTSYTGGLFHLDENNKMFVKVSTPSLVEKGKSTFFGYFLLT